MTADTNPDALEIECDVCGDGDVVSECRSCGAATCEDCETWCCDEPQ